MLVLSSLTYALDSIARLLCAVAKRISVAPRYITNGMYITHGFEDHGRVVTTGARVVHVMVIDSVPGLRDDGLLPRSLLFG